MTTKEPNVGAYLDDEEKALIEAIEAGQYDVGDDLLTPERKAELQDIAHSTLNPERDRVTIRLSRPDL